MGLQEAQSAVSPMRNRFELDRRPVREGFIIAPATDDDIEPVLALAMTHLPGVRLNVSTVRDVHRISQGILVVKIRGHLVGVLAILPLKISGFVKLMTDDLSVTKPDTSLLARHGDHVAAIYAWALCLPGTAIAGMGVVMKWLQQAAYKDSDIYARPGTVAGERFMAKVGFVELDINLAGKPLWLYRRPHLPLSSEEG